MRKKKTDSPAEITTPAPAKPTRTRKKPAEAEIQPEPTPIETKKSSTRTRKKATEPEIQPEVAPAAEAKAAPRSRRKPAPQAEVAEVKPAARPARRASTKNPSAPAWSDPEGRIVVEFRPRSGAVQAAEPTPEPADEPSTQPAQVVGDGDLVILEWRSNKTEEKAQTSKLVPRKGKGQRGEKPISAADALAKPEPAKKPEPRPEPRPEFKRPEPPAPPPAPVREPISIPADAPQVVLREGIATIVRDQRAIAPIFFFVNATDEDRAQNAFEQIRMAADQGIHVFWHYVELEVNPAAVMDSVAFAGYLLKKTLEIDPKALVLFRVVFTAPDNWASKHPQARYRTAEGEQGEPSVADDGFWGIASECLVKFTQQLRSIDNDKRILGLHLERGEWFMGSQQGYDTSPAATHKFRQWLRTRYRNDVVALRASWFDGRASFETLEIPPLDKRPSEDFVLTGRKARRWVDYHLFISDVTCERIQDLAYQAKKASEGYFLVGVSYGYTFEWSHAASGHLSLGKLLRTPEVDIVAGPPSYKNREPGGTCPFPCPIDSVVLNGKLYISEEDFKTSMGTRPEPDDFNPVIRTPQALDSVQWRGAGAALAHGAGVSWMDLWGNGWLASPGIWERAGLVREALVRRYGAPARDPDVAVFIDERSLAYLADQQAFTLLVQNVREAILRSGLSAGFYLLSDLAHRERFPDCKLHVFVNAWDIRPEVRTAIRTRLQRDGKVLFWMYAAGLFDSGRESLERVREATGIALKPQPFACKSGTTMLNRRHPLCEALPERILADGGQLEPSYFAIPEDGLVLGEYSQTGLPSFVVREFSDPEDANGRWKSVFLGEAVVTPAFFRALGQMAGVQAWNYHDDVVHVRPPYLTIHCANPGPRTITLPDKWAAYDVAGQEWAAMDATHLRFNALNGSTNCFMVGAKGDLEAALGRDMDDLATVTELPSRPENTVRIEDLSFDVPIMKLGEWMEETWTDEMADDLLLKPSQFEIEAPEGLADLDKPGDSKTSGRRRRRRRNGKERNSGPEIAGERFGDPAAASVNVMFRKRE